MDNAARWSNDLILRLTDEYEARPRFGTFFRMITTTCSRDFACATAGELSLNGSW